MMVQAPQGGPFKQRIYRMKAWARRVCCLSSVGAFPFVAVLFRGHGEMRSAAHWIAGGLAVLAAAYLVASAFYSHILLDEEFVSARGIFLTRWLPKQHIRGVRRTAGRGIGTIVFVSALREEDNLSIMNCYEFDQEWSDWVALLPELDD